MAEPRITEVDMLLMEPKLIDMIAALPLEFHKKYAKELLVIPRLIPEIQRLREETGQPCNLRLVHAIPVRISPRESMIPKEQCDGPTV